MRVAIEGTVAIKRLGGISEYARQLIVHLSRVDEHNDYTILTTALNRRETYALPELAKRFHERKLIMPARVIEQMWRQTGYPSMEMLCGPFDVALFPRPVMCRTHAPSVAAIHDLSWLKFPELAPKVDRQKHLHDLRNVAQHATAILAISQATKQDIVEHLGVDPQRIYVTMLGYDEALAEKPSTEAIAQFRATHGLGDVPYFLHVGTLEPRKNLVRLVHAFSAFKKRSLLPHKLVLAGRAGWLFEDIHQAIADSAVSSDIVLAGAIGTADRVSAYWGAQVVVFPSLYEGFGLPILEAQCAHRPVITGSNSSLAEVGGDSVVYVDVKDESALAHQLYQLATKEALREQLVKKGLNNIKRFSWDKTARETLAVLDHVCQ